MAETISHSPLFYLDLLPFSYITLYTYTPIDVFQYCCIVVLLYKRQYLYTSIHIYNTVYCHIFTSMLYLRYFLYFTFPFI